MPAGHSLQPVAPRVMPYCPTKHFSHRGRPVSSLNFPSGQNRHDVAPYARAYFPGIQWVHVPFGDGAVPDKQPTHTVARFVVADSQKRQPGDPVVGANFPTPQGMHASRSLQDLPCQPAGQDTHCASTPRSSNSWYAPGLHSSQSTLLVTLNALPVVQNLQATSEKSSAAIRGWTFP